MTEDEPKKKNLSMFKRFTPQVQAKKYMSAQQKHQTILAELVRSKYWDAIKFELSHIASKYETPPPAKLSLLIGYHTYSIIRDGFNQLIAHIESEALKAPDAADFDS